ncbi:MAG: hypothetical protein ONB44_06090 [candidate division KSB1 bacterium]|nr:hypothetical protein [candidate division KSB1 bacterium]MDZ7301692.1 hypothetical protein [candidate division KSB1 bacterium]MDZ7312421.1 hypothetical protein [candidate division KSB1 bacterium]
MKVDEIRKIAKARPFKAFEIHGENGEKLPHPTPGKYLYHQQIIVTVDEQGQSILIAP